MYGGRNGYAVLLYIRCGLFINQIIFSILRSRLIDHSETIHPITKIPKSAVINPVLMRMAWALVADENILRVGIG